MGKCYSCGAISILDTMYNSKTGHTHDVCPTCEPGYINSGWTNLTASQGNCRCCNKTATRTVLNPANGKHYMVCDSYSRALQSGGYVDTGSVAPVAARTYSSGAGGHFNSRPKDINEYKIVYDNAPKCECGAHKVGSNAHSTWCDLFKKGA